MSGKRVSAAEGVHGEIDALFADAGRGLGEVVEQVAQLRVLLVFQRALEAEAHAFLDRKR